MIGIPNVRDRVLQAAAAQWLQERIEPILLPTTFAYRPALGPQRAAAYAARLAADYDWVITADIEKYFDNVDHDILAGVLGDIHVTPADLATLMAWLRATPIDRGTPFATVKGLPQGLTIAPSLANLYLHDFDRRLHHAGWKHARFADDFVVFATRQAEAGHMHQWMASYLATERKLKFKAAKTAMAPVAQGFDFVGFRIDRDGLRFSASTPDRFKTSLEARLRTLNGDLDGSVRTVNDLVRGWRAYYGGMSDMLNEQLAVLEGWRRVRIAASLSAAGHPQLWLTTMFESLTVERTQEAPGAYGPDAPEAPAVAQPPAGEWSRSQAPQPESVTATTHRARKPAPTPARKSVSQTGRTKAIRALAIGITQRPWVTETGDLMVPMHGAFVTRAGETLVVKRKQQTVFEVPLTAVKHVSVIGQGASLSGAAIVACVARGIRIWIVDRFGRGLGFFTPARSPLSPRIARLLLRAAMTRRGTALARDILSGKLLNQRALLLYYAKGPSRPPELRTALRNAAAVVRASLPDIRAIDAPLRVARQELFLVEARAAAAYWAAFARLVPVSMGFPGRRGRGATDPVNTLLNYGYYKLLHVVWLAVDRVGLIPWLGVMHTGRRRSPALVLDLMEEFRAVAVDRVVLGVLGRGFQPRQRPDGRLRLTTKTTFEHAWEANLVRPVRSGESLERLVRTQAGAFRRALEDHTTYRPVVMSW